MDLWGNIKSPEDKWKWQHDNSKLKGCSKAVLTEIYSYTGLYQETNKKISNNLTRHLKELEREE